MSTLHHRVNRNTTPTLDSAKLTRGMAHEVEVGQWGSAIGIVRRGRRGANSCVCNRIVDDNCNELRQTERWGGGCHCAAALHLPCLGRGEWLGTSRSLRGYLGNTCWEHFCGRITECLFVPPLSLCPYYIVHKITNTPSHTFWALIFVGNFHAWETSLHHDGEL